MSGAGQKGAVGQEGGKKLESRQEMRPREQSRDWDVEERGLTAPRAQEGAWSKR